MINRIVSAGLLVAGLTSWITPGFNGLAFDASDVSSGEGQIVGAIFMVGVVPHRVV